MKKNVSCLVVAIFAAGLITVIGFHGVTWGQTPQEFYRGKTIRSISAYPGVSGMGVIASLTAKFLEKHIGVNVISQEKPGAGGTLARNYVFASKPDGLTIMLSDHGPKLIANSMFGASGATYEWAKFVPLGKLIDSNVLIFIDKKLTWSHPRDLAGQKFFSGASSPFHTPLFAEALGWDKLHVVPGYRGLAPRVQAIASGELQAAVGDAQVLTSFSDVVKGLVFAVKHPQYPKIPSIREVVLPGREKWAEYEVSWGDIMYMALAPPGIPKDRAKFLEDGLKKVYSDPDFKDALEKVGVLLAPKFIPSEKLETLMNNLAKMSPNKVKELKYVIKKKYVKK